MDIVSLLARVLIVPKVTLVRKVCVSILVQGSAVVRAIAVIKELVWQMSVLRFLVARVSDVVQRAVSPILVMR
jgi:hypothetical protein